MFEQCAGVLLTAQWENQQFCVTVEYFNTVVSWVSVMLKGSDDEQTQNTFNFT